MSNEVLELDGLTITILETPSLGDRSYVVDDGVTALVVDPQRDLDRVHAVLAERSVTLGAVAETHAHNDYVSGGLELARSAQVPYLVPCEAEVAYERVRVCDEDVEQVGTLTVRTIGTPGHTPHHVAFAVGTGDRPAAVFTGGSMLFGAVGRTDLVDPSLTDGLTRAQHASVRKLAADLPPGTAVLPTHGFGSFCSATPTTGTSSTIAEQRTQNPALTQDEDDFVRTLIAGLDAYPAYYAHMGPANLAGPAPVDLSPAQQADADQLRDRIEAGEWVVDLRSGTTFARGHLPGTFSFDASGNVVTYLGWLVPWGTPITLLGDSAEQVAEVQRELVRIGIDRPAAQATAPVEELAGEQPLSSYETATFADLAEALEVGAAHVLDVRSRSEWEESHLEGVQHLPLHELVTCTDRVPDGPLWVHCATGFRASIAGSVLDRAGKSVIVVADEYEKAATCGLTVVGGRS